MGVVPIRTSAQAAPQRARVYVNEQAIEALRRDPRHTAWLTDSDIIGFKVRKTGAALTFCFVARNPDGRVVNVRIGRAGVMSLAKARTKAQDMRAQIEDGTCPRIEQEAQERQQKAKRAGQREARDWTVKRALQSKLDDPSLTDGSRKNYRSLLNVALAKLADRRLDDVGRAEWKRLLDKIKRDVSAAQAAKVRAMSAALYRQANGESENLKLENPLADLRVKLDDASGQRRQTRIQEDDLADWFDGLDALENATVANLAKLTLLVAMREAEARLLRWSEIRGDDIIIPAERTKVKKALELPITKAMRAILDKQKGRSKEWVFPSPRSRLEPISPILPQMKRLGYTVHDLRRTALSIIDTMGVPQGVRRKIANHAPGNVPDGYVVAERADVLKTLTNYHERLEMTVQFTRYRKAHPDEFPDLTKARAADEPPGVAPSVW